MIISVTKQKRKEEEYFTADKIPGIGKDKLIKLNNIKKETEKSIILNTLNIFNGNCQKTAQHLGISIRTLYYKIQKYQIKKVYNFKSD